MGARDEHHGGPGVVVTEGYLAVLVPFAAVGVSIASLWRLSAREGGWLALGAMAVTALAFAALRERHPALARAHAFAAALAGALSLAGITRSVPEAVVALSAYGVMLHACAGRLALGRPVRLLAHVVMAGAALSLSTSLVTPGRLAVRLALLGVAVCAYAAARARVRRACRATGATRTAWAGTWPWPRWSGRCAGGSRPWAGGWRCRSRPWRRGSAT